MITFTAIIKKFADKGEKTGWTYIEIPTDVAEALKPGNKKSFRVKGKLDDYKFEGVALLPLGDGDFIMALNATIRKEIRKQKGGTLKVQMEEDKKVKKLSALLMEFLAEEPQALKFFKTLPNSHQKYFSDWIESARTEPTKAKRIAQALHALSMKMGFSEMMRMNRNKSIY